MDRTSDSRLIIGSSVMEQSVHYALSRSVRLRLILFIEQFFILDSFRLEPKSIALSILEPYN